MSCDREEIYDSIYEKAWNDALRAVRDRLFYMGDVDDNGHRRAILTRDIVDMFEKPGDFEVKDE